MSGGELSCSLSHLWFVCLFQGSGVTSGELACSLSHFVVCRSLFQGNESYEW